MSAIGILRSFAEARCADHEPIPARLTYGTIREVLRIIEEWERSARKPTNETTPDAVAMLQWMHACVVHSENHGDVPRIGSDEVLAVLRATQDERARHAEEVAALRDQLRKVEGERDVSRRQCGELHEHLALIVRYFEEETSEGDGIAEQHYAGYQLAKIVLVRTAPNEAAWETAMVEFAQLQERASHVPGLSAALDEARHELDARRALDADVRACAEYVIGEFPENHPAALTGSRILAALDSHECPECHMVERCKMSCSRGGSKGARAREGGE